MTVYDSEEKPGGSLRYLIPEFRLPGPVLDAELQPLWEAGVRFVGDSKMHYETDPQGLFDAGFDAVVLSAGREAGGGQEAATGRAQPRRARVPAPGSAPGTAQALSGRVVVVGDGITALDAARTALRSAPRP